MKKTHIQLLKKQIKKLDSSDFDLEAWKVSTQLLLNQVFGKYDEKTITIRDLKIDYSSTMLRDSNANYKPIETCKKKGREILELAVDELELSIDVDNDLKSAIDSSDRSALESHLKKYKKGELIKLLMSVLGK